ncbi:pantetheine-phosphate adenylyltransferase [bacterium]|nr:pantetheine-phosphate adenylyltransferase [bacterium]
MTRALYPGTFDPMHNGHLDIAQRAASIFAEVIVGVYHSPPKKLLFSTDERVDLARAALVHLPNVTVVSFFGLTVECAREVEANVIVRGLRNVADYQFESQIGLANRHLAPEVELCCLVCGTEYTYLSSTIVKEVAGLSGDISAWVVPPVAVALSERFAATRPVPAPDGQSKSEGVSKTRGKMSYHG